MDKIEIKEMILDPHRVRDIAKDMVEPLIAFYCPDGRSAMARFIFFDKANRGSEGVYRETTRAIFNAMRRQNMLIDGLENRVKITERIQAWRVRKD